MRDIKFRAWVGSHLVYRDLSDIDWHLPDGMPVASVERTDNESLKIMQYTGLKDKNGVEIYEGDILQDHAVVEWFTDLVWDGSGSLHSGFYCKKWGEHHTEGDPIDMSFHSGFNDENIEVIGNIYKNPELLK